MWPHIQAHFLELYYMDSCCARGEAWLRSYAYHIDACMYNKRSIHNIVGWLAVGGAEGIIAVNVANTLVICLHVLDNKCRNANKSALIHI